MVMERVPRTILGPIDCVGGLGGGVVTAPGPGGGARVAGALTEVSVAVTGAEAPTWSLEELRENLGGTT